MPGGAITVLHTSMAFIKPLQSIDFYVCSEALAGRLRLVPRVLKWRPNTPLNRETRSKSFDSPLSLPHYSDASRNAFSDLPRK